MLCKEPTPHLPATDKLPAGRQTARLAAPGVNGGAVPPHRFDALAWPQEWSAPRFCLFAILNAGGNLQILQICGHNGEPLPEEQMIVATEAAAENRTLAAAARAFGSLVNLQRSTDARR